MNIKVVVVDELPDSCLNCRLLDMVYGDECPLNDKKILDIYKRPDWCPLVSWEEYVEEMDSGLNEYLGVTELFKAGNK